MATPRNLRILPGGRINGLPNRRIRGVQGGVVARSAPGPVLFFGGCTYAAAYLLLSFSGLSALSGVLALAGTLMIVLGLRKTWERS
ncbi:MAG: hypothetical protein A3K65_00650 [Euryarchaeota archaeon RBG_16_68_12]|nr:MAG: hypothetical protein A3K65_00650 [Euryarchaeota archaeon RBG_16_68_12]